jgi:hypothetical protein
MSGLVSGLSRCSSKWDARSLFMTICVLVRIDARRRAGDLMCSLSTILPIFKKPNPGHFDISRRPGPSHPTLCQFAQ